MNHQELLGLGLLNDNPLGNISSGPKWNSAVGDCRKPKLAYVRSYGVKKFASVLFFPSPTDAPSTSINSKGHGWKNQLHLLMFKRRRPFWWMFTLTGHFENHRECVLTHPDKPLFVGCVCFFFLFWFCWWKNDPCTAQTMLQKESSTHLDVHLKTGLFTM